jgi:hypothetical protein
MLKRRIDLWLPTYLASAPARLYQRYRRATRHTHVIFLICDHFEPQHAIQRPEQAGERLKAWGTGYAAFQERCRSEFGTAPLHTWFYPPHHGTEHLADLAAMAHAGLGEVELHYHHDGDTEATLERDLRSTLDEYHRWGLLLTSGHRPVPSFGFIHGDWALANSGGGQHCGVNNELHILQKLGCWADLTMPSANACQTRKINAIYYGTGSTEHPKGHDWGPDARTGSPDQDGLMMIQGPLGINWAAPSYPRIENASLTSENWGRADRIRKWIDCHVHVQGRPEWLFVKLHTHGAIEKDFDALFGEKAMAMHRELNRKYNDGKRFSLHYVTARQAYNIAKAAEHGQSGDPSDFLDFRVAPPTTALCTVNARHTLEHCTTAHLKLSAIEADATTCIRTQIGPAIAYSGRLRGLEIDLAQQRIDIDADGAVELTLKSGAVLPPLEGATQLIIDKLTVRLNVQDRCSLRHRISNHP